MTIGKNIKYALKGFLLLIGAYLVFIFVFDGGSPRKVETFVIKSGSVDLVLAVVGRVKSKQLVNIRPEQPGSIMKAILSNKETCWRRLSQRKNVLA